MSSSSLGLNTSTLRTTLPFLTGALHTLGTFSGLYFLLSPSEGAKIFGTPFKDEESPTPNELAVTRIHGVRDLTMGVVGLRLVNYAYKLEVQGNVSAAKAVGYAIGSLLIAASAFPVMDGWIVGDFAKQSSVGEGERAAAEEVSFRHTVMGAPIALLGLAWLYV